METNELSILSHPSQPPHRLPPPHHSGHHVARHRGRLQPSAQLQIQLRLRLDPLRPGAGAQAGEDVRIRAQAPGDNVLLGIQRHTNHMTWSSRCFNVADTMIWFKECLCKYIVYILCYFISNYDMIIYYVFYIYILYSILSYYIILYYILFYHIILYYK